MLKFPHFKDTFFFYKTNFVYSSYNSPFVLINGKCVISQKKIFFNFFKVKNSPNISNKNVQNF